MENKVLNLDKSSWVLTKLGDLAKDISKRVDNPGVSEYDRFVGLGNFVSGDIKIKTWETTENLVSSAKAFQAGDILFARRNAYLRRASLVDFDGCCSGDAFVLRENHDKVVPGFLAFLMNSNALWDYANSNAAGTMSKRVKWRDLAKYEFLLPPKDQQAQLAKLLWAMDQVIEKEDELLDKLKIQSLVEESCIFNNERNLRLKDVIVRTLSGGTPNTKKLEYYSDGEIPWITTKILDADRIGIGEKLITQQAVSESAAKLLLKGNIVAGTRVGVGKFAINDVDISFSQDITGLEINNDVIDVDFLIHQLNSSVFQENIKPFLRGTTIKGITKDDLLSLKIYNPSFDEQKNIKDKVQSIKNSIMNLECKIKTSQSLQKSLINQVF
ncbi:MAG: restriction endonuclease subunit S [Oceanospirillaceae bacterium]|nr:restriction endonuclease subunit S [Oceanospirillaceae bacterium]